MKNLSRIWLALFGLILFGYPLSEGWTQSVGRLSGIVTDAKTNTPLIAVNVMVQGTLLGAATDSDGTFEISSVPQGNYSITFSMMGYKTLIIPNVRLEKNSSHRIDVELEETILWSNPVIITAGKHPQTMAASHQAMEVIEPAQIFRKQSRSVDESLLTIPGVHFNEENISIRGSSGYSVYTVGSRILLMIDGVPVLTSDLATVNWQILPLLDVQQIEVVKGAGSALYGSSAMGGVVNIITRRPSEKGRLIVRGMTGIYDDPHYDVWDWTDKVLHYKQADLTYSRRFGGVGLRFTLARQVSTGYMENGQLDRWNISGRADVDLPGNAKLDIYLGYLKSRQGFLIQWLSQNQPFSVPPFNKDDEMRFEFLDLYTQARVPISASFAMKFRISHLVSELGSQLSVDDPTAFKPGRGLGAEIQADWIPGASHHIIFGTEIKRDHFGSKYFGNFDGYTVSPYAQHEWIIHSSLRSTIGLRWDRHEILDDRTDSFLSPKFGINFQPSKGTTLRASTGSGFRAATAAERYIKADYSGVNVIPNPDLKSERAWFWDFGLRQNLWNHGHLELSVYQSDYWDLIEPVINFLGTIQFQNFARARIRGIELGMETWWWRDRIGLAFNGTWMDPMDLHNDRTLPYRPRWMASLIGSLRLGATLFQSEYRYASRVDEVELNPLDPRVPMKLVYFRAQWQIGQFTIQAALNNAFNYHYTQVERRMREPRNASLSILMDIQ